MAADPGEEEVRINGADHAGTQRAAGTNDGDFEIVDDTPVADRDRRPLERAVEDPSEEELAQYSAGVKKRFSELTHARHDERRSREAAERERDEAIRASQALLQQNRALQQRTANGETHLVAVSKANAEAALMAARRDWQAAKDAFDPEAELKAQEAMLEAKIQLREIERYRPPPVQSPEEVVQLPSVSAQSAPVDQKTLRWQARNQWFGTDGNEEMTALALAVHKRLTETERIDPRSDEYFRRVDSRLREVFPDFFEDTAANGGAQHDIVRTTPRASPVASATRSANGVTKVRLTTTQLTLAKKFGLTPQQYAQEVVRLEQQPK